MNLIHLKQIPIFLQLQLEEALLRLDERNFCLINEGPSPAIVMGISGVASELIDLKQLQTNPIPIIRRFSGGGTVVVDEETICISFICNKTTLPFTPYPEPIMRWSEEIYREAISLPTFSLKENDYVMGENKFGGNAQYLRKDRWLHHSTILWNYQKERMSLLQHPKKTPSYRSGRSHDSFLTPLSRYLPSKNGFISSFKESVNNRYPLTLLSLDQLMPLLQEPHRKSTTLVDLAFLLS